MKKFADFYSKFQFSYQKSPFRYKDINIYIYVVYQDSPNMHTINYSTNFLLAKKSRQYKLLLLLIITYWQSTCYCGKNVHAYFRTLTKLSKYKKYKNILSINAKLHYNFVHIWRFFKVSKHLQCTASCEIATWINFTKFSKKIHSCGNFTKFLKYFYEKIFLPIRSFIHMHQSNFCKPIVRNRGCQP